jgi:hypothetical protein
MKDSYIKVNLILLIMIIGIFIYSYCYPYLAAKSLTIPSFCERLPDKYCKSSGLTRAFSEIIRLRIAEGRALNVYAVSVFTFFLVQLIFRVIFPMLYLRTKSRVVGFADVIISGIYFITVFSRLAPIP